MRYANFQYKTPTKENLLFYLIYKDIESFFDTKWNQRWKSNNLGQINYWFKDINIQKSKKIMKLPRDKLSVLVRFITRHCLLKRQNV